MINLFKRELWVESSNVPVLVRSDSELNALLKFVEVNSVSTVYLQAYRFGTMRTVAELQEVSTNLRACGIEVHAWINCFYLGSKKREIDSFYTGRDCIDSWGSSTADYSKRGAPPGEAGNYFQLDTPGYWADPGELRNRKRILDVVTTLIREVSALSGIHLDYIRYPYLVPPRPGSAIDAGSDFGYGSIAKFCADLDLPIEKTFISRGKHRFSPSNREIAQLWDEWRRLRIGSLVQDIRLVIGDSLQLSAAVLPWPDRAYLSSFQDWRSWLTDNLVRSVCLMSSTSDIQLFRQMVRQALAFRTDDTCIKAGIGTWLLSRDGVQEQIKIAEDEGCDATVLFSYNNMREKSALSSLAVLKNIVNRY